MAALEPNYREGWLLRGQKLNEANSRADAAEQRVAELEAALRPFEKLAAWADEYGHQPGSSCDWRIHYDDLAAARDALKGEQQ